MLRARLLRAMEREPMNWLNRAIVAGAFVALAAVSAPHAFADELRLEIPTIGVSAAVESIGLVNGNLDVPSLPDDVGSYQIRGNLLVVGHRDWDHRLRGFARLDQLQVGDLVELTDGRTYSVVASSRWYIDDEPGVWRDAVRPGDGDAVTLISCIGEFSVSRQQYLQRIMVRAERIE